MPKKLPPKNSSWVQLTKDFVKEWPEILEGLHFKNMPVKYLLFCNINLKNNITIHYDIKKELHKQAGELQFIYTMVASAKMGKHRFILSKADEGHLLMFPSMFLHTLCPFYTSKNVRLSIAGNILFEVK